jgi:polysaccharide deacetylase family protein (PEP-CTERM system associated)
MSVTARRDIVNAMTVDVEDYFQVSAFERVVSRTRWDHLESRVAANTRRLLEVFERSGVRATFFVLGWVADRAPLLVRQIADAGHEIACHSYNHQLLYNLTPRQFRDDVRQAKVALEQVIGRPVVGFRAPSYSITASSLWALDVLIEEGYQYDASIFPIHHDRYGIPDAARHAHMLARRAGALVEVPASTVRLGGVNLPIAGGGYFRLLPYLWTKWGISRVNRVERAPVVFYLHPWEIDPDQPRLPASATTRMRHYGGLRRTNGRLRRLLNDFRFDSIASVLNLRPEETV